MSLFKKKSEDKPKPFVFIQEEVKAKSESEQTLLKQIELFHHQKNYELALAELLLFFNMHPERNHFVLFLAATVLHSYFRDNKTEAIGTIADPILWDRRLDPIFMSCSNCHSYWVPAPSRSFYANSAGSQSSSCPNCGRKTVQSGRAR